jgi:hypothetical protein
MVKSSDLQNRAVIEGPAPAGADEVTEAIRRMKPPKRDAPAELAEMKARIEQADNLRAPRDVHCGCCYGRGRADAVMLIRGPVEGNNILASHGRGGA